MSFRSFLLGLVSGGPTSVPEGPPLAFARERDLGVGTVRRAALSPAGTHIAVATSRGVAVFDVATGGLEWRVASEDWCIAVAYSGDGRRLVGGTSAGRITLWDAASGEVLATTEAGGKAVVALDKSGRRAAIGTRSGVTLWQPDDGETRVLEGTADEVLAVAFAPDDGHVAAGEFRGTTLVWRLPGGVESHRWRVDDQPVRALAFSGDGCHLAAAGKSWTVWNLAMGVEVQSATAPGPLLAVALDPDAERIALGSKRNRVLAFDMTSAEPLAAPPPHLDDVHSVALSGDGRTLVAASQKVQIYDFAPGGADMTPIRTLATPARVLRGGFDASGSLLALADRQLVTIWDAGEGTPIGALDGHTHTITGIGFAGDGVFLSMSPREIIGWDPRTGERRFAIGRSDGPGEMIGAALSGDRSVLITASRRDGGAVEIAAWDAAGGSRLGTVGSMRGSGLGAPEVGVAGVAGGGAIAAVRAGTRVAVWRWTGTGGSELHTVEGVLDRPGAVALSPDGATLATAAKSGDVVLWDGAGGHKRHTLSPPTRQTGGATHLTWSPDSSLIAVGFKARPADQIALYDVRSGKPAVGDLEPGAGARICHGLVIHPENRALVAGFADNGGDTGVWAAWHLAGGARTVRRTGPAVTALAVSPAGDRLVVGCGDGGAELWSIRPG